MSIHLHISSHECKNCKTRYIPYEEHLPCPKCGEPESSSGSGYRFISSQVNAMVGHLNVYKQFTPFGWSNHSYCDQLQWLVFRAFDRVYKDPSVSLQEEASGIKINDAEGGQFTNDKYILDLFIAIDNELRVEYKKYKIEEERKAKEKEDQLPINRLKRLLGKLSNFFKFRKPKRNAFLALCDIASQNNWCWKIYCTTCGHGAFRVSFNKLIIGDEHPDNDTFWPFGKGNSEPPKEIEKHPEYWNYYFPYDNQQKLVEIVVGAKISELKAFCRFPDWLGYLGLVMEHCPSRRAHMTLSSHFIPQFLTFFEKDNEIKGYLENKLLNNEPLTIADLNKIEKHWPFLG